MVDHFTQLQIWQLAKKLYIDLHLMMESEKDYFFRSQILRAALSISNNIAEGFGRKSKKEFNQFLSISKGSCNEVESMLLICMDIGKFSDKKVNPLLSAISTLKIKIGAFINALLNQIEKESK